MPGERRKRQQRVRHEVGGAAAVPAAAPECHDGHSATKVPNAAPTAAAKVAAVAPAKTPAEVGRGGAGAGRGSNRGGAAKAPKRGVAVATVDESQYYQPVTIMESKPRRDADAKDNDGTDELEEAPHKYKRRAIVSNWSRYEQPPTWDDVGDEGSDYLIGEDFSEVLTNQSLGSGGGGHLRLRGEESWGGLDDVGDKSQLGLGALRVSDLVSTMGTVPLTMQLGFQPHLLPEQLADFYTKIADDNRQAYDPLAATDYVDDAELIEEQIRKLRLAFFDEAPSKKKEKPDRKLEVKSSKEEVSSNTLDSFMDPDIGGELSTKIDFTEDLGEDGSEQRSDSCKVDLTAKMCQAFGSNIKDVVDDNYADFVTDNSDINGAVDSGAGVISHEQMEPIKNLNKFNSNEIPSLQTLGEANRRAENSKNSIQTAEKITESPGLDFSSGHQSFNFSLPKPTLASAALKPSEPPKDEDVFAPAVNSKSSLKPSVSAQQVDLDAPIVPKSTALVTTQEDTKELEDWLDSVLDD